MVGWLFGVIFLFEQYWVDFVCGCHLFVYSGIILGLPVLSGGFFVGWLYKKRYTVTNAEVSLKIKIMLCCTYKHIGSVFIKVQRVCESRGPKPKDLWGTMNFAGCPECNEGGSGVKELGWEVLPPRDPDRGSWAGHSSVSFSYAPQVFRALQE